VFLTAGAKSSPVRWSNVSSVGDAKEFSDESSNASDLNTSRNLLWATTDRLQILHTQKSSHDVVCRAFQREEGKVCATTVNVSFLEKKNFDSSAVPSKPSFVKTRAAALLSAR